MAALNDSITSFTLSVDVLLGLEALLVTTDLRFVRGVPIYCTISSSFFMKSHYIMCSHVGCHGTQKYVLKPHGSCYVNKTAMSPHGEDSMFQPSFEEP